MPQQNQDFAIALYETNDPEQSFKVLATFNEVWAVKFREHLKNAHGLDISQSSIQINKLTVNWKRQYTLYFYIYFLFRLYLHLSSKNILFVIK